MSNSGNKWPINATLLSAVHILAPVIKYYKVIDNIVTLIWTQDEKCIPVTGFTIYEDGIPVKIVSGNTRETSITIDFKEYVFYIVASNTKIISDPSNSVTVFN
jgi:hypothetical protein